jgi:hypothetical protein
MSDYSIQVTEDNYSLALAGELALVFVDEGIRLTVEAAPSSIKVVNEIIKIVSDKAPGIPSGGNAGYVLAKQSSNSFDVQWVPHTKITVGLTAPSSPSIGDLWVDTN